MRGKNSTELLVQSGVIPENTLRQMVQWKSLPEETLQSYGSRQVTLENGKKEVTQFVSRLQKNLDQESLDIRETEFSALEYTRVTVHFPSGEKEALDAGLDRLGRIHLPWRAGLETVAYVSHGTGKSRVLRVEPRYRDQKQVAWVCYLEEETNEGLPKK